MAQEQTHQPEYSSYFMHVPWSIFEQHAGGLAVVRVDVSTSVYAMVIFL
jgi:hypothetical protein